MHCRSLDFLEEIVTELMHSWEQIDLLVPLQGSSQLPFAVTDIAKGELAAPWRLESAIASQKFPQLSPEYLKSD